MDFGPQTILHLSFPVIVQCVRDTLVRQAPFYKRIPFQTSIVVGKVS